jgi:hypothetical protein
LCANSHPPRGRKVLSYTIGTGYTQGGHMRRRNFITLLGSTMVMRSLTAHAQQSGGMRRIGVLMGLAEGDPQAAKFLSAFRDVLRSLGWRRTKPPN